MTKTVVHAFIGIELTLDGCTRNLRPRLEAWPHELTEVYPIERVLIFLIVCCGIVPEPYNPRRSEELSLSVL